MCRTAPWRFLPLKDVPHNISPKEGRAQREMLLLNERFFLLPFAAFSPVELLLSAARRCHAPAPFMRRPCDARVSAKHASSCIARAPRPHTAARLRRRHRQVLAHRTAAEVAPARQHRRAYHAGELRGPCRRCADRRLDRRGSGRPRTHQSVCSTAKSIVFDAFWRISCVRFSPDRVSSPGTSRWRARYRFSTSLVARLRLLTVPRDCLRPP